MPIYEYRCNGCHRRVSILICSSTESLLTCPSCGRSELTLPFSSFSVRKSDKTIYEDILSDSQLVSGLESDDPRALAEWNMRMSGGEKVGPGYEEAMDSLEAGQWPAGGKLRAD